LPVAERTPLLAEIRGVEPDETAQLAAVVTQLTQVQVGIASCDEFVVAVTTLMACPSLGLDQRLQLATETVDAWSLPVDRLSIPARAKIAAACHQSLGALRQHALELACSL
jgi:hypothetical protein